MSTPNTFGELGEIFDGPHATPTRTDRGPYFLNISSLSNGRLDLAQSGHVAPEQFTQWTRRVTPKAGDLLFSYETRLGEAALMPAGIEACLGRRMALLRPDPAVCDPRFLLYYYLSPGFQSMIARNAIHGATVDRIPLTTMGSWPISCPSLPEQRAIAEVLGALDDKIAANLRCIAKVDAVGMALFEMVLSAGATSSASVGQLIDRAHWVVSDGYRTRRSELASSGYRIVRVADVMDGIVDLDGTDFVSTNRSDSIGAKHGQAGDVVLTTKGTIGRVAILPKLREQVVYSPQVCFFRASPTSRLSPSFIKFWLQSSDFRLQASHRMNNTDMAPYINLRDIRSMVVPIPSEAVLQEANDRWEPMERLRIALVQEDHDLVQLRDTLLPHFMSGTLRVRDAEKQVEELV